MCGGVRECAGVCMSVCMGLCGCVQVWEGVHGCAQVCAGVRGCARVCTGVRGYAWVWDVFSEFLLENRVPTSADFNTFPIRIFYDFYLIGSKNTVNLTENSKFK